MSHRVVYSPDALDQLASLRKYIAGESNAKIADRYIDSIIAYCETLSTFPRRGTRRDDLFPGLRTVGFERRATIAFLVGDDVVTIVGVFYGGQDLDAAMRLSKPS